MANKNTWAKRGVASALAGLLLLGLAACGSGDDDEPASSWQTTWATAPTGPFSLTESAAFLPTITLQQQTVRMVVRSTSAGDRVRIRLSNEVGDAPLAVRIGAAHIGLRDKGSSIVAGTGRTLSFDGKAEVLIPPKGFVYSDPVSLNVPALSDLAISLYLPDSTQVQSGHFVTRQTSYLSPGNTTSNTTLPSSAEATPYWFLATGLDVQTQQPMALVAFGDSITDGFGEQTLRTDAPAPWPSWPSRLADRIASTPALSGLAVLNAGISGNRVMSDAPMLGDTATAIWARAIYGPKGVDRFQRDALDQRGATCVVILQGINDIGIGAMAGKPVTADALIAAYQGMIAKAKGAGLKVIGGTLTPFRGYASPGYYSEANDAMRIAVNTWIRTSGAYDGVIDFDAALRNPNDPTQFQAAYDSGDHLHPSDAGYKAMADAVDLNMVKQLCIKP